MKIIFALLFALLITPAHAVTYQGGKCIAGCQTPAERVADWMEACDTDKDVFTEAVACRVDDDSDGDDSDDDDED